MKTESGENKVVFCHLDGLKGAAGMCVLFVDRS